MNYKIFTIVIYFLTFLASTFTFGQNLIKGSVKVYNSDLKSQGINVIVIDTSSSEKVIGTVVDSTGRFRISTIPNGKIDLQFSFIGCYHTIIKEIELENDTIEFWNIPVFESNCEIAWDGICVKKFLWGLIRITRECGGTDYYKKSQFPANNRININCWESENDSILYELNPKTKKIEVEYKKIKICRYHMFKN